MICCIFKLFPVVDKGINSNLWNYKVLISKTSVLYYTFLVMVKWLDEKFNFLHIEISLYLPTPICQRIGLNVMQVHEMCMGLALSSRYPIFHPAHATSYTVWWSIWFTHFIGSGNVFGIGSGNDGSSGGKHLYSHTSIQAGTKHIQLTNAVAIIFYWYTISSLLILTADYISIMESLVFAGTTTFDRQCVNIIILDDDISEGRFSEFFTVEIRVAEEDANEVLLQSNSAFINIIDDDRKLNFYTIGRLREKQNIYNCPHKSLVLS